jgi:hypothetical protein
LAFIFARDGSIGRLVKPGAPLIANIRRPARGPQNCNVAAKCSPSPASRHAASTRRLPPSFDGQRERSNSSSCAHKDSVAGLP